MKYLITASILTLALTISSTSFASSLSDDPVDCKNSKSTRNLSSEKIETPAASAVQKESNDDAEPKRPYHHTGGLENSR